MAVHILKMAVGIESVEHLCQVQADRLRRLAESGDPQKLYHWTRNTPRRAEEITDGGSIYWIIKGYIRARQRIISIDRSHDAAVVKKCGFVLDPMVVFTNLHTARPIQGWRYLEARAAPLDKHFRAPELADMPEEMARELQDLGLL